MERTEERCPHEDIMVDWTRYMYVCRCGHEGPFEELLDEFYD